LVGAHRPSYPSLSALRRACKQIRAETLKWLYQNMMGFIFIDKFLNFAAIAPPHGSLVRLALKLRCPTSFLNVDDDLATCLSSIPQLEDLRLRKRVTSGSECLLDENRAMTRVIEGLTNLRVLAIIAANDTIPIRVLKNKAKLRRLRLTGHLSYPSTSPRDGEYKIFADLCSLTHLKLIQVDAALFPPRAITAFVPLEHFSWADYVQPVRGEPITQLHLQHLADRHVRLKLLYGRLNLT